jgi:hypothetical protein
MAGGDSAEPDTIVRGQQGACPPSPMVQFVWKRSKASQWSPASDRSSHDMVPRFDHVDMRKMPRDRQDPSAYGNAQPGIDSQDVSGTDGAEPTPTAHIPGAGPDTRMPSLKPANRTGRRKSLQSNLIGDNASPPYKTGACHDDLLLDCTNPAGSNLCPRFSLYPSGKLSFL